MIFTIFYDSIQFREKLLFNNYNYRIGEAARREKLLRHGKRFDDRRIDQERIRDSVTKRVAC